MKKILVLHEGQINFDKYPPREGITPIFFNCRKLPLEDIKDLEYNEVVICSPLTAPRFPRYLDEAEKYVQT